MTATSTVSDQAGVQRLADVPLVVSGLGVQREGRTVLSDVSLTLQPGELMAVVGPNGTGKSTLLAAITGDLPCDEGQVQLYGHNIDTISLAAAARLRAVLPQDVAVSFPFTVEEIVRMGRAPWHGASSPVADDEAVEEAIAVMDLKRLRTRTFVRLSGGERARVAMARVLCQKTPLLLLDEPTASLDVHHQEMLMKTVRRHVDAGGAAVAVLHDLGLAGAYADRVALLGNGRLVAVGSAPKVLNASELSAAYQHPVTVFQHPRTGTPVVVADRRTSADRSNLTESLEEPMTTPTTAPDTSFAAYLRAETATDHSGAEGAGYMTALMEGSLSRDDYALLTVQHWHIYRAIEAAADRYRHDPVVGCFVDDRLNRMAALEIDLAALYGANWQVEVDALIVPATERYVEAIEQASATGGGFVAHHYTRYLGDLSGGIFIGRKVVAVYDLPGEGSSFYRFDEIDDATAFKDAYRANLDAAGWATAEEEAILEEVHRAYRANTEVFIDLSAIVERA